METMHERYWTTEEVAKLLRVSKVAVRNWVRQGKLPGVRIGRPWMIADSALKEVLSQKAGKPQE
jgi:excisionase family DNA binding protein